MPQYKALLVAPSGAWVTDYVRDSVEEVAEALADRGSTWCFYPFEAIILHKGNFTSEKQRIVEAPGFFSHMEGKSIGTFVETIGVTPMDELRTMLDRGW